ncbi:hypothetical protein BR93DRAFT_727660 [Coniochaeta sp. PMI_546]|nr:hypothetical protein BR93DRAFT_727660 [Coniochaeta sp. PMI_546]
MNEGLQRALRTTDGNLDFSHFILVSLSRACVSERPVSRFLGPKRTDSQGQIVTRDQALSNVYALVAIVFVTMSCLCSGA